MPAISYHDIVSFSVAEVYDTDKLFASVTMRSLEKTHKTPQTFKHIKKLCSALKTRSKHSTTAHTHPHSSAPSSSAGMISGHALSSVDFLSASHPSILRQRDDYTTAGGAVCF